MTIESTLDNENIDIPLATYVNKLIPIEKQRFYFSELFKNINGYQLSYEDRKQSNLLEDRSYTYSEVDFDGFKDILNIIQLPKGFTFYDCGSGIGKALVLVSLLTSCKKLIGREKLPGLLQESKSILSEYISYLKKDFPNLVIPEYDLKEDDFLKDDFSEVDLVFLNSTCYDDELMESSLEKFKSLKSDSYIITVTKQIDHSDFECIHKGFYKMNWGTPTVYIYKKI